MTITDTLANAKRLEKLGLTPEQAEGLSEIVEEAARAAQPDLSDLVTKDFLRAELERQNARFDAKFAEMRADIDVKFAEMRADIDVKSEQQNGRIETKLSDLRTDFSKELRQQMMWFFAMQIGIVTVAFALFKLAG